MEKHSDYLKQEVSAQSRDLVKARKRLNDLDKLFQKAFEQMALERLWEQQFQIMMGNYENEKQVLTERSSVLKQTITGVKDKMLNSGGFLKIVDKYVEIQVLTPELVREFIDRIVVYVRGESWKKKNYPSRYMCISTLWARFRYKKSHRKL